MRLFVNVVHSPTSSSTYSSNFSCFLLNAQLRVTATDLSNASPCVRTVFPIIPFTLQLPRMRSPYPIPNHCYLLPLRFPPLFLPPFKPTLLQHRLTRQIPLVRPRSKAIFLFPLQPWIPLRKKIPVRCLESLQHFCHQSSIPQVPIDRVTNLWDARGAQEADDFGCGIAGEMDVTHR